jgi:predicted ATP-dependent serine protease
LERVPLDELEDLQGQKLRLRSSQLNMLLDGRIMQGQMSLLHGPDRAPLTFLSHLVAIDSLVGDSTGLAVFIDSGSNYSPLLARRFCDTLHDSSKILSRLVVAKVLSLIDLELTAKNIELLDRVNLVVLDSLTGVLNLTGAPGSKHRQRSLFQTLEVLRDLVNEFDLHLLMTDHSSKNWSSGRPAPIGGNVLAHAVDSVFRIDRLDTAKDVIRILVERSPVVPSTESVIVRMGKTGLRGIG